MLHIISMVASYVILLYEMLVLFLNIWTKAVKVA